MRAVRFYQFGPPSVLHVEEVGLPPIGSDDVLVEVKAAAINPSDVKNVQGLMPHTTLPRTPGRDFAGIVRAGPPDLFGQEVWGSGGDLGFERDGTHAAQIVLPRAAVRRKPANLSFEQAASVGVPFTTAWAGLVDAAEVQAGETVLIIGAAGAVGSAAIQIARWRGARVLGVIRRDSQRDQVEQFGAEAIVNTTPETLAETVREATDNQGASLIFDTVGGPLFEPCLRALARRGRLIEITTAQRQVTFDLLDFYRRELRLFGVNSLSLTASDSASLLELLTPGFGEGAFHAPPIAERFGLNQATTAYMRVAAGNAQGKILLIPDETALPE